MSGDSTSGNGQAPSGNSEPPVVYHSRLVTIPNLLCLLRMAGSVVLIALALFEQPSLFVCLFVFLILTDWLDGKLAILLNQRSVYGARLDSAADAALYFAMVVGLFLLNPDAIWEELWWIGVAALSYLVTTAAGLYKFHRVPSYHTRAAKTSWLLITIGVLCLLGDWGVWPFRVALLAVTLTNLEATAITIILREPQTDVTSVYHACRDQTGATPQ